MPRFDTEQLDTRLACFAHYRTATIDEQNKSWPMCYTQTINYSFASRVRKKKGKMFRRESREQRVARRVQAQRVEATKQLTGVKRERLQQLKIGHTCSGRCRLCAHGSNLSKSMSKQKGAHKARRVNTAWACEDANVFV